SGAFAADVEDIGSLRHLRRPRHGPVERAELPAIGKTVGCYVEDAHDPGPVEGEPADVGSPGAEPCPHGIGQLVVKKPLGHLTVLKHGDRVEPDGSAARQGTVGVERRVRPVDPASARDGAKPQGHGSTPMGSCRTGRSVAGASAPITSNSAACIWAANHATSASASCGPAAGPSTASSTIFDGAQTEIWPFFIAQSSSV